MTPTEQTALTTGLAQEIHDNPDVKSCLFLALTEVKNEGGNLSGAMQITRKGTRGEFMAMMAALMDQYPDVRDMLTELLIKTSLGQCKIETQEVPR